MTTSITALDSANVSPGTGSVDKGKEINIATRAVTGGTMYITTLRGGGSVDGISIATTFVASNSSNQRQVKLSDVKTVAGVPVTAAAQANIFGITFTPGTAEYLLSEAANSNTKTDVGCFEVVLPDSYVAGTAFGVTINAHFVIGAGTLSVKTLGLNVYRQANDDTSGVDLNGTAAPTITGTAADYAYVIAGTSCLPGDRLILKLTMTLTETGASNVTGRVNSVRLTAV